jgi:PIN domain nuclease of toxin-antitoxin system
VRLLLDTVVLIFAVESPERLTKRAATLLQNTENILELSAISLSEIAIKTARGNLRLSAADTHRALEDLDLRVLPYTAHHAFYLFDPGTPRGPVRPPNHCPGCVRKDPGGHLRREIQLIQRSQSPLVIL